MLRWAMLPIVMVLKRYQPVHACIYNRGISLVVCVQCSSKHEKISSVGKILAIFNENGLFPGPINTYLKISYWKEDFKKKKGNCQGKIITYQRQYLVSSSVYSFNS